MGILGIGVDIVHVPRIAQILQRRAVRFPERILSSEEIIHWKSLPEPTANSQKTTFLAVRWSIKEAAFKAIYPSFRPTWKDFTYFPRVGVLKPSLLYTPSATVPVQEVPKLHITISHDGDYVFTSVLAETAP